MLTIALIAAAAVTPAISQRSVTHRVEVDGANYRVRVKDGAFVVARKALIVSYDVKERDRQRRAVEVATGCRVSDELPSDDGRLRGKLDCSNGATALSAKQ